MMRIAIRPPKLPYFTSRIVSGTVVIDSSRDQSVREVFTPLAQLAERTGCAVLIIRHLTRGGAENPLYRGAGSIGIIAAARIGLIVAPDPSDQNKRILATTKNNLSKQVSNLTYQVVENEHGVPHIQWLEENHHPVKALFTNANISYERRAILKALQDSSSPLYAPQVASSTGLDYKNVRRMLPRLLHAGEIASPARGQYTALEHASLTTNPTKNCDVSTEANVPTMTTVPSVPTDETTPEENSDLPAETTVPIVSTDDITQQENSDPPVADNCADITLQISPPSAVARPLFALGSLSGEQASQRKTPLRTDAGSEESRREQTCIVT